MSSNNRTVHHDRLTFYSVLPRAKCEQKKLDKKFKMSSFLRIGALNVGAKFHTFLTFANII